MLLSKLNREDVDSRVSKKKEEFTRQRKKAPPTQEIENAIISELGGAWVVARMAVVTGNSSPSCDPSHIFFIVWPFEARVAHKHPHIQTAPPNPTPKMFLIPPHIRAFTRI